jgi:hypothetical protein
VEEPVQDVGPLVIGLLAFNALVFAALYSRRSRPELAERCFGWVLRADLALAERQAFRTSASRMP